VSLSLHRRRNKTDYLLQAGARSLRDKESYDAGKDDFHGLFAMFFDEEDREHVACMFVGYYPLEDPMVYLCGSSLGGRYARDPTELTRLSSDIR
jgi:hypothetical protein